MLNNDNKKDAIEALQNLIDWSERRLSYLTNGPTLDGAIKDLSNHVITICDYSDIDVDDLYCNMLILDKDLLDKLL